MSLFSLQEICNKCEKAVWHECCKNFCHCKDGHEQTVNGYNGTCEYKVVLPQANVIKSVCEHQPEKYGKCIKCGEQIFNKSYDNEQTVL